MNNLVEEFNNLLNNNQYISKKKYDEYIEKNNDVFLSIDAANPLYNEITNIRDNGYDRIDEHNQKYLDEKYIEYKEYFENMYKGIDDNIKLDGEQIKAILAEEDNALIIAGAGTGKTTTMTSKVKYLVDIKKVDPTKILVMSYTKKATMELEERIVDKFKIPACVTTFHSLGYKYIKQIFKNRKCKVVDENDKDKIFLDYFKTIFEDKEKIKEIISLFRGLRTNTWLFGNYFMENYEKYDKYDNFLNHYKEKEIYNAGLIIRQAIDDRIENYINGEHIITIKGETVRSKAEAIIANFLFTHGIQYQYEKVSEEIMDSFIILKQMKKYLIKF